MGDTETHTIGWHGARKVVFLLPTLDIGGSERQALHLARWLKADTADVQVWGLGAPAALVSDLESSGLHYRSYPMHGPMAKARTALRVAIDLRSAKPDVVLPYAIAPNVLAGMFHRSTSTSCCIWNQRDEGQSRLPRIFENIAIRRSTAFVSNSEHGAAFLAGLMGDRQRPIHVVHNGIALPTPKQSPPAWRERLGLQGDDFVGCMIANLTHRKDHVTAIQAWRDVVDQLQRHNRRAVLVLAGRMDATAEPLRRQVDQLGLTASVRFAGHINDIAGLLQVVDLGVHSSKLEGIPNGVLECMAAGKPVVATDIPGHREALADMAGDLLTRADDAVGMAARIVELASDRTRRASLGKRAATRVRDAFSVQAMCTHMVEIIEACFNRAVPSTEQRR